MPSLTRGARLEPRTRCTEMQDALQARVHDPLWLLGRQWQFGEFQANDSGSPARVELDAECARLTRYRPGPLIGGAQPYASGSLPLETLVEREPVQPGGAGNLGAAVDGGLQFLRLLAAYGVGTYQAAYRTIYALAPPTESERRQYDNGSLQFLDIMARRVPDGTRLYADLSAALGPLGDGTGSLPAQPVIGDADRPKVRLAAGVWLKWCAHRGFSQPTDPGTATSPWIADRMEYEFAVAARTSNAEVVLAAPEYLEGHLDWYSFVVNPSPSVALGADADVHSITGTVLPAPVTFRGMPASRLWEMEDARVNFGKVKADSHDLARLLLLEFALVYGNDWFVIPVELPVGSVCRVRSLVVTDTFGQRINIPHSTTVDRAKMGRAKSPWRMFSLSPDRRAVDGDAAPFQDLFFLPPALGHSLQSSPVEEVLLLRDEMANMAWAVERVVESPIGRKLDRYEAFLEKQGRQEQGREAAVSTNGARPPAPLVYRLGTSVPDYWIPLIAEAAAASVERPSIRLRRGAMPRTGSNGQGEPIKPLGRVLEPDRNLLLYEEEVPREGARVTRSYQYARWIDGSTHLWIGRRKQPGRGEGSSGLRFDVVEPVQEEEEVNKGNLLSNAHFEKAGPEGASTSFSGKDGGISAADMWTLWHTEIATTVTRLLPSTFAPGDSTMIHVNTTGMHGGLVQVFGPLNAGPWHVTAAAWVFVKRGQIYIGTGNGGNIGRDAYSQTTNGWELLQAPNGVAPANEFIVYAASDGGAEFYVAQASVSETP